MRLALLIARRTVVSLDCSLSMSGSRAMVSSFLLVVALRPAQVFCTSGLKSFDSRTACDSLTARAWSSDVKAIQACRNFALLTMYLIDDADLTVRRDSQSSCLQVSSPVTPLCQSSPDFDFVESRLISRRRADTPQDDEPQYSKPEDRPRVTIRRRQICLLGMFLRPSSR
jgi:hypothetical protein